MFVSSSQSLRLAALFIKLNLSAAPYIPYKFTNTFNFLNKSDFISKNKAFVR